MDFLKWLLPPPSVPKPTPDPIPNVQQQKRQQQQQRQTKQYFTTLPPVITTGIQFSYNYGLTFASKLQPSYTGYIHYAFPGKENEPNVTIARPATNTAQYVSKDLYIFSKIHEEFDGANGELVLEHAPLANSDKPLFVCFPLITDPTATTTHNILYKLMTADESAQNADIDLSLVLPPSHLDTTTIDLYETAYAHIALVYTPIRVPAQFVGFNRGKIDELWALPIGGIERVQSGASTDAPIGGLFRPKIVEGMAAVSAVPAPAPAPASAPAPAPQLFFECDYSDIELQNETPTYMIPVGSDQITLKEKTLNYAISLVWVLAIVIATIFLAPFCFSIFATIVIPNSVAKENRLEYVNSVEAAFIYLLGIPAIVLLSVGASNSIKCADTDTDCIKKSNELIMPGTILMGIGVFFLLSISWFKYSSPDFLGYRDVGRTDPYYRYERKDLFSIDIFNFISAGKGILRILYYIAK